MVDAINTGNGGFAVTPATQNRVVSPLSGSDVVAVPTTAPASTSSTTTAAVSLLKARTFDDPLAGVLVSQQLDAEGNIRQQTPSSSVLAYLQNGLTIEGYPKQSVTA